MKFIISFFIFICDLKLIEMTDNNKNLTVFNDTTLDSLNFENKSSNISDCIGNVSYCNYSKEEYTSIMYASIYPKPNEWVMIGVYSFVFIVGLVGNTIVCLAVYRNRSMRTVTNYFIVNLAVGDVMTLFCLPPFLLSDVTHSWFLGEAMCKAVYYVQSLSVTVSVLTLTMISVDRWYAICLPLKFKSTTGRAKIAILFIWMLALIFNIPNLIAVALVQPKEPLRFDLKLFVRCTYIWSHDNVLIWKGIQLISVFTLPFLLMAVAYHQIVKVLWRPNKIPGRAITTQPTSSELAQLQSRKRAAKILVALVVVFAICYFPGRLSAIIGFTKTMMGEMSTCMVLLINIPCYVNCAINPIIFNFLNDKFRDVFRRAFCCQTSSTEDISVNTNTKTSNT